MKTDMNKKQKNTRTFLIKIMDQQNGSLAGQRYLGGRAARAAFPQCP